MFKRILFPTDFSPCADTALTHALFHAEVFETELHILHGVVHISEDVPYFNVDPDTIEAKMDEVAKIQMAEALAPHRERPFQILEENIRGRSVPNIILEYAADRDCDLIVMGTHGRRFLSHFLLGSTAEAVTRLAPCPVITVRAGDKNDAPLRPIRHILAPIDFAHISPIGKELLKEQITIHDSKVTLLHVMEDYFYPGGIEPGVAAITEVIPKLMDDRKKRLESIAQQMAESGMRVHTEVVLGRPSQTIVKFAQDNDVDLIVAGTGASEGLSHLFLGSTVERIMRIAPCPVFTYKHQS